MFLYTTLMNTYKTQFQKNIHILEPMLGGRGSNHVREQKKEKWSLDYLNCRLFLYSHKNSTMAQIKYLLTSLIIIATMQAFEAVQYVVTNKVASVQSLVDALL